MDKPTEAYRDACLLVVDKASGVPTQSTKSNVKGLHEQLKACYPYVGLHHRLDQPTSGLVLFTLEPDANRAIANGFRNHNIQRTYLAVMAGRVSSGQWNQNIDGKSACTHITALSYKDGMSTVKLTLETGRTHQIRLHAAQNGHPVLGDRRYGAQWGKAWSRIALHATRLTLRHPMTNQPLSIHSPVPPDLQELWSLCGGPDTIEES